MFCNFDNEVIALMNDIIPSSVGYPILVNNN